MPAFFSTKLLRRTLPLFLLLAAWGCRVSETEGDQYLTWDLSESLEHYARVEIVLTDAANPSQVYERVWNEKLAKPREFPRYKLTVAKGKDFRIRIRCYDAKSELLLEKHLDVKDANPQPQVLVLPDLRLHRLSPAVGTLDPDFDPDVAVYSVSVPDSMRTLALQVAAMDPSNSLSLNQQPAAWGILTLPLPQLGSNGFELAVAAPGATPLRYSLNVVRVPASDTGRPNLPQVSGTSPTGIQPKWTWVSGGGGGSGNFRYKLNDTNLASGATPTRDIAYTLAAAAESGKTYTLYVQESNAAGKWSRSGSRAILYDVKVPSVAIGAPQSSGTYVTKTATAALSGSAGGPEAIAKVTYAVNQGAAVEISLIAGAWNIPSVALVEGESTLVTVTALDVEGKSGSASLTLFSDRTAPGAPILTSTPSNPTKEAKGSWAWKPGSDAGKGSGLNGKYRYSLDGGKAWTETVTASLIDQVLAEGANPFEVQEQDMAGNWSASISAEVKADRIGPTVAVTSHPNPAATASLSIVLSGTAADAGSGVASVAITGQIGGSGATVLNKGNWTSGSLTLKQGANALEVTATDSAGSYTVYPLVVNANQTAAVVEITHPASGALTNKDTITVKYKVDGTEKAKLCTLGVDGKNLVTVFSASGEGGGTGSDTVTVLKDSTPPKAPILDADDELTNLDPAFTITSRGDSAGGAGLSTPPTFRYSVDGGQSEVEITSVSFTIADSPEGVFTVTVQERDKAGNWSARSNPATVQVDTTPPVVTILSPPNNSVSNREGTLVTYTTKDGAAPAVTKTDSMAFYDYGIASNVLTVYSPPDAAGNVGQAAVRVYKWVNVLFVKAGATGDGSSWTNAFGSLAQALAVVSNQEIWIAAGSYASPATSSGFAPSTHRLYGGFSTTGLARMREDRTFAAADTTTLSNPSGASVLSIFGDSLQNVSALMDGLKISVATGQTGFSMANIGMSINNCVFQGVSGSTYAISGASGGSLSIAKCSFKGFTGANEVIKMTGNSVYINTSDFSGNRKTATGGKSTLYVKVPVGNIESSIFSDVLPTGAYHIEFRATSATSSGLVFRNSVFNAVNLAAAVYSPDGAPVDGGGNTFTP